MTLTLFTGHDFPHFLLWSLIVLVVWMVIEILVQVRFKGGDELGINSAIKRFFSRVGLGLRIVVLLEMLVFLFQHTTIT